MRAADRAKAQDNRGTTAAMLRSLDRLERVATALHARQLPADADADFLVGGIQLFIREIEAGMSMQEAFGLVGCRGAADAVRRRQRDRLLCQADARFLSGLSAYAAASEIIAIQNALGRGGKLRRSEVDRLVEAALATGAGLPAFKQLTRILLTGRDPPQGKSPYVIRP